MFSVGALASGLADMWDTGIPQFIGHDHHRLIGWVVPLSVHLQPGLGRLTALIQSPETVEEEQAVLRAYNQHIARRTENVLRPARQELQNRLKDFLQGEPEEAVANCAALVQSGLATRAFSDIFGEHDKDGLISLRELNPVSPGVFERGGLLFFAHPFLRRSLSRLNTLNSQFLSKLFGLTTQDNLKVRIALDPDMVGLSTTLQGYEELQFWFGPHFNDDLSKIPLGVSRHESSETDRFFSGVSRTEFWWYEQKGIRTFECEELQDIPALAVGSGKFGCRFVHSLVGSDGRGIQHADGAVRVYDEAAMLRRLDVDLKGAGRKTDYTKLWRVDGGIPVKIWKALISDYYRDNTLIGEYLGGRDKTLEEYRRSPEEKETNDAILNYVSAQMTAVDGVNVSVSFRPIFCEAKSGRQVVSFDTLRSEKEKFHYIESDTIEIVKLLRSSGRHIEMEPGLTRVLFEDRLLNLPIFVHAGNDRVRLADETLATIACFLNRMISCEGDKQVSLTLALNYEQNAVMVSFAGTAKNLVHIFSIPEIKFPAAVADFTNWCVILSAVISKQISIQNCSDMLWETLKHTGILKFERKILHPSKYSARVEKEGLRITVNIPNGDLKLLDENGIGLGRFSWIRKSQCSKCARSYDECLHTRFFDGGVIHQISELDLLGLFWRKKT